MVMGILLGMTFISIALYLLLFPDRVPPAANEDIRLYALLTGAYGIWRLLRVFIVWNEAQKNV